MALAMGNFRTYVAHCRCGWRTPEYRWAWHAFRDAAEHEQHCSGPVRAWALVTGISDWL